MQCEEPSPVTSLSPCPQVTGVKQVDSGEPVKFSTEVLFTPDRYEIV